MKKTDITKIAIGIIALVFALVVIILVLMNSDSYEETKGEEITIEQTSSITSECPEISETTEVIVEETYPSVVSITNGDFSILEIGNRFYYGNYNGLPLQWTVIDSSDEGIMVITTDAVDVIPYNDIREDITWEDCSLRQWLNSDFYNAAFSEEEASRIMLTDVNADENPYYDTESGNSTQDKIYLLSVVEAETYFDSDEARICNYEDEACWWWLRSPGCGQHRASMVCVDGTIGHAYGFFVDSSFECVRPVMWITVDENN